jgi:hypothetical protein
VVPYALEAVALLLLNGDVTHVGVSDDGAFSVTVEATTLQCDADPDCEAWDCTGPGGRVISMPGGGLAIWDAI